MLLVALPVAPAGAVAQGPPSAADDEREQALVEGLRREDPSAAERYVALRDARAQALGEVRRAEAQFSAASPELRPVLVARLRQARRAYAERSLALLDFFESRDRQAVARYQEEIGRINRRLEEHARTRSELEKLLE
jgi:hypothetical protein